MTARPCEKCSHRREPDGGLPANVRTTLETALRRQDMNQNDLARAIDCHPASVSRLLQGSWRPTRPVAWDLARALSLTFEEGCELMTEASTLSDRRPPRLKAQPKSPEKPPNARHLFRAAVIAHLAAHGRTRCRDLYALRPRTMPLRRARNELCEMKAVGLVAHPLHGFYEPLDAT